MTELCKLAQLYGVDKCPSILHSYTPEYNRILQSRRDSAQRVVEIGIGNYPLMSSIVGTSYKPGASLRMWRDYFPNATVIGCDILPSVLFNDEPRIETCLVDQSSAGSLVAFRESIGTVDMILDDGSHNEDHMILSFRTLWQSVAPNGIYIIEDIRRHSVDKFAALHKTLGFGDAEVLYVHYGKDHWDGFVAFRKTS